MKRRNTLVVPQHIHDRLREHLFPGDGLEAAALLLCSVICGQRTKLLAREVLLVPHGECQRSRDFIRWPGNYLEAAIDLTVSRGDAVIAIHSHPAGLFAFSEADDTSDRLVMPSLFHGTDQMCGSAIMIPSGAVRARFYQEGHVHSAVDLVMLAGPNIELWWSDHAALTNNAPPPMAFTHGMRVWLAQLSVCIIGVSGTGSIVAEQLARLGVGEIILIDFDKLEARNLNRILNSSVADLDEFKVDMFTAAIRRYRPECDVVSLRSSIADRETLLAACETDALFSCVDTAEGRHIADRLSAYCALPLFDVGVAIPTEATPENGRKIAEVYGRVDYVFPGGSSLMDRGVYDAALLEAEYLARTAPKALARKVADGYLQGQVEEAPAVIAVNMRAASACVLEFLARLFPFRAFPNEERARAIFMLSEGDEDTFSESHFFATGRFPLADGLTEPLLGLPALAKRRRVA